MAATWIDLRGEHHYGISASDSIAPQTFPNKLNAPVLMGPFTPNGNTGRLTIAGGNRAVLDAHNTKIVRAVDLAVEVTLSMFSYTEFVPGWGLQTQLQASLRRVDVVSSHFGAVALGRPRERFGNGIKRNPDDVPPAAEQPEWTWTVPQQGTYGTQLVDRVNNVVAPRAEYWTQRGSTTFAYDDTTLPLNFLGTSDLDFDAFGGAFVLFPAQLKQNTDSGLTEIASTMDARFTRLRVLVDDRPTWKVAAPKHVGLGLIASTPIKVTLTYPSGEPVIGETVRISTGGARVLLATGASSQFRAWAQGTTNSSGQVTFRVQGTGQGVAAIEIINGRTDLQGQQQGIYGNLYSPPLFGAINIDVYGGPVSPDPDEEPDFPPPPFDPDAPRQPEEPPVVTPGETICTTYPAVEAIQHVPPRTVATPVNAWDAGANSVDELEGDVRTAFSLDSKVVGLAVGFVDHRDDVQDYARLMLGVLVSQDAGGNQRFRIMEYGRFRTGFFEYVGGEIEIRRVQGAMSVWYDGTRLYQGTETYNGALLVGSSLYSTGDSI